MTSKLKMLLTEKEAAQTLALAAITLRKQRCEGARKGHIPPIPFCKLGKSIRYRLVDLEEYAAANLVTPTLPE